MTLKTDSRSLSRRRRGLAAGRARLPVPAGAARRRRRWPERRRGHHPALRRRPQSQRPHARARLCRYALRPPLAQNRLHVSGDGEIWLTLRYRWADGTTHLRFEPLERLERLAVLTPRPRINLILYYLDIWACRRKCPRHARRARHPGDRTRSSISHRGPLRHSTQRGDRVRPQGRDVALTARVGARSRHPCDSRLFDDNQWRTGSSNPRCEGERGRREGGEGLIFPIVVRLRARAGDEEARAACQRPVKP